MNIWAIGDLHLSFAVPNKSMDLFGPLWKDHAERLQKAWRSLISPDDLVLIPGDISWAMRLEDAVADLAWIHDLPGTKVLIKGNHDLWWGSLTKLKKVLPPSIHVIQNDLFSWHDRVFVGGARLWDSDEYSFDEWIDRTDGSQLLEKEEGASAIFRRELLRLEESLKKMPRIIPEDAIRIGMVHYPPVGPTMESTRASSLFTKYGVSKVVFGHLHSLKADLRRRAIFGTIDGVEYILTSCDWLYCTPRHIHTLS